MAYNKSERPDSPMKRRGGRRRKKVAIKRARHIALMPYVQD